MNPDRRETGYSKGPGTLIAAWASTLPDEWKAAQLPMDLAAVMDKELVRKAMQDK